MSRLKSIREQIDELDEQICLLLRQRMALTAQVAESKRESSVSIRDEARERQVLERVTDLCGGNYGAEIYRTIMRCSRAQQAEILGTKEQNIIDISREILSASIYPGNPASNAERVLSIAGGDICNLTELRMCVHNATHIDAPLHFIDNGGDIMAVPENAVAGRCIVAAPDGEVTADFIDALPQGTERLLLRGGCELSPAAAKAVVRRGLRLVGVECDSVGGRETHLILLEAGVVPLEGIDLSAAADGEYVLLAHPLKIAGSDGSPCRALLIKE